MKELLNFFQITENIGTSGQPTAEQFTLIASEGYAAVVNLAMADSDNALSNEAKIIADLDMAYIYIPVPFDKPTAAHLKQFFDVLSPYGDQKALYTVH